MVDLLGYADAGCSPTLTTTTDVTAPVAGDSWSEDCIGGVAGAGTPWDSKFMNRLLQQVRVALRMSGVPLSNSYDNMLSWAMQSGYVNWLSAGFTGTANALAGSAPNSPIAVEGGTLVCGIVETPTNTGAATFNWSGLGVEPVVRNSGVACTGGEIVNGCFLMLRWDGGSWRIVSPTPDAYILNQVKNTFTQTGVGATISAFSFASSSPSMDSVLGNSAAWTWNAGGYAVITLSGGASFSCADNRWPGAAPPGTWELTQVTVDAGGGVVSNLSQYGSGSTSTNALGTFVRTA